MENHLLYLASKSASRRMLLEQARLPFTVLEQSADEAQCDWNQDLETVVRSIAQHKMEHVIMPAGTQGQIAFVITADTLNTDARGSIFGKPTDVQDAKRMIRAQAGFARIATGFCIRKSQFIAGCWHELERREGCVVASCVLEVPEPWLERFIAAEPSLVSFAGALAVDGYASQFVKSINGSYTAILGLPLYEVREALEELGFFADQ